MNVSLRKDEAAQALPPELQEHPLFSGRGTVGIMTAQRPKFDVRIPGENKALLAHVQAMGLRTEPAPGAYDGPEDSFFIHGPTREQMYDLGRKFGQEAVIFSSGGRHEMLYTNGPNDRKHQPSLPKVEYWSQDQGPPENYYTQAPKGGYFRLHFDEALHETPLRIAPKMPQMVQAEISKSMEGPSPPDLARSILESLKKSLAGEVVVSQRHPHAYEWHETHTDHYPAFAGLGGVVIRKSSVDDPNPLTRPDTIPHPHTDGAIPGKNDQAAGVGVPTYEKFAVAYGNIDKASPSNLKFYDYDGKSDLVNQLVSNHGYQHYYAGGKYGRPDLANKNYNTGHLMIYDPSPDSGASFNDQEYTDNWRKVHELAHALVYPELNQIYGEGRRIGRLGKHRTLREAQRAVHWEWLAAHKQRELSKQLGVEISDEDFHKELNTVMHDAVHRAVTGKFTEPSGEGFKPHGHKVPLEHALGTIAAEARNLGLQGQHDLMTKTEQTITVGEIAVGLAGALRKSIANYEAHLLELRERELAKARRARGRGPWWTDRGSEKPTTRDDLFNRLIPLDERHSPAPPRSGPVPKVAPHPFDVDEPKDPWLDTMARIKATNAMMGAGYGRPSVAQPAAPAPQRKGLLGRIASLSRRLGIRKAETPILTKAAPMGAKPPSGNPASGAAAPTPKVPKVGGAPGGGVSGAPKAVAPKMPKPTVPATGQPVMGKGEMDLFTKSVMAWNPIKKGDYLTPTNRPGTVGVHNQGDKGYREGARWNRNHDDHPFEQAKKGSPGVCEHCVFGERDHKTKKAEGDPSKAKKDGMIKPSTNGTLPGDKKVKDITPNKQGSGGEVKGLNKAENGWTCPYCSTFTAGVEQRDTSTANHAKGCKHLQWREDNKKIKPGQMAQRTVTRGLRVNGRPRDGELSKSGVDRLRQMHAAFKGHAPQNMHGQNLPMNQGGWPPGTETWAKPTTGLGLGKTPPQNMHGQNLPMDQGGWPPGTETWAKPTSPTSAVAQAQMPATAAPKGGLLDRFKTAFKGGAKKAAATLPPDETKKSEALNKNELEILRKNDELCKRCQNAPIEKGALCKGCGDYKATRKRQGNQ